jgi:hypothetical protein
MQHGKGTRNFGGIRRDGSVVAEQRFVEGSHSCENRNIVVDTQGFEGDTLAERSGVDRLLASVGERGGFAVEWDVEGFVTNHW